MRLASASLTGITMACVQVKRLTDAQALADIATVLKPLAADERQESLNHAASAYARPIETDVWHAPAAALLERAGADLDEARRLRDGRGHGWLQR